MTLWTQGVNSPPWQRRGGRAINQNEQKAPLLARPGWFVQLPIIGGWNKPPRLRPLRRLRVFFLMGAATPPSPRRGVPLHPRCQASTRAPNLGGEFHPLSDVDYTTQFPKENDVNRVGLAVAFITSLAVLSFAQARETYADLPGVRLWYKDSGGGGVPVVFLHSNTGSSRNWDYQIPVFTAAGFRFIAYDRRGWGRSVTAPGAQPGTAADDLHALMKYLGIDRFHLVATAGGGFVALDYALSFPDPPRSLVIANSIGGVQDEDYLELGRRLRPPQFDALPPELRELGPSYRASDPEGTKRWIELERMS